MTEIVGFDFAARIRGIALKLGSCKRGKYYETFFGLVCCHLQFFCKKNYNSGCWLQLPIHTSFEFCETDNWSSKFACLVFYIDK